MLPSDGLEAFFAIVNEGGFTKASQALHISQSAVSQRILHLEEALKVTLFVRQKKSVQLTSFGEELLRHCKGIQGMEEELLSRQSLGKKGQSASLTGTVRLSGFSSILRSVVQPVLCELALANPALKLELCSREIREMLGLLLSGAVDFAFTDAPVERAGINSVKVGFEHNVFVELSDGSSSERILDHDVQDSISISYFNKHKKSVIDFDERSFLGDINGIIDGLLSGLGRAVVPLHLVAKLKKVRRVKGFEAIESPIFLNQLEVSYDTHLRKSIFELLLKEVPKRLQNRARR